MSMIKNETGDICCPECGEQLIVSANKIVAQKLFCENQFCQKFVVEFWSTKIPKTKEDKMPEQKRQVGSARFLAEERDQIMIDIPTGDRFSSDYTTLDNRLIITMDKRIAADLMHLLEEWKDER